jgi:hypothetical protein
MQPEIHNGGSSRTVYAAHVVPYLLWVTIMIGLDVPEIKPAWRYALQTVSCTLLLLLLRPWRWYAPLQARNLPLACAMGVVVFVIWVGPETVWIKTHFPGFYDFYMRYFAVQPWSDPPLTPKVWPYAPEICGWNLTLVRLTGSSVVIALCEELFWRSFIYRWMLGGKFWQVDLGQFHPFVFLTVNIVFGIEHSQWFAGILAGLAFGWVLLRTRDLWAAVITHGVTNYLLGLYVLATGDYHFW